MTCLMIGFGAGGFSEYVVREPGLRVPLGIGVPARCRRAAARRARFLSMRARSHFVRKQGAGGAWVMVSLVLYLGMHGRGMVTVGVGVEVLNVRTGLRVVGTGKGADASRGVCRGRGDFYKKGSLSAWPAEHGRVF